MAVQTMGLDYSWLVDLAKMIAAARQQQGGGQVAQPSAGAPAPTGGATSVTPYAGPTSSFAEGEESAVSKQVRLAREDKLLEDTRKHEITMQKLQNESPLAVALAQERGGTEQAKIAGAATVAANQKTTADKAKETIDVLMKMTPEGQMEALNAMEAKDAESGGGTPSGGTISSPGKPPITLPGSTKGANPNSPLTWIKDTYGVDARTVIANLQPKTVAAGAQKTAANLLDDFQKLVIKGDLNTMLTLLTGGQGATQVTDALQQFGESNGYPQEVIDDVKATITGLAPTTTTTGGEGNVVPPKGLFAKAGGVAKEAAGRVGPMIGAALHPGETSQWSPEYAAERSQWEAAASKQPEVGQESFIRSLADALETAFRGPFAGGTTTMPTAEKKAGKQVGPTVNDAIADMKTWDANKIKAFQKKAGVKVDGKMSPALTGAMKAYFEKHKDEWR